MGSTVDLTLGCSTQAAVPYGYHSDVLHRTGSTYPGDYLGSLRKAEKYLQSMVDERRKVEGFKRELPICIQLLEDAIRAVKEKLANGKDMPALQLSCSSIDSKKERYAGSRPTLEESLPLKRRWGAAQQTEGGSDGDTEEPPRGTKRPAWMAEAQFWTQNSTSTAVYREEKEPEHLEQEQSSVTSSQLSLSAGSKDQLTGAFLPFPREQPEGMAAPLIRPTPRKVQSGAGLTLSFAEPITSPTSLIAAASDSAAGSIGAGLQTPGTLLQDMGVASIGTSGAGSSTKGNSSKRKARRCWSPELHCRFVSALHQLGGAEIATPKQICELMKVAGLTNDEVKSHLQKYRLHTRRPSPSPQSPAGAQSPNLVVVGGIWMPPKYTLSASQPPTCVYDASTGQCHPTQPTQSYQSAALPQDRYYACISNGTAGAPVQMHRQPVFEPQQAASQSQSSPQEPLQVTSQLSGATQGPNSEVYHDESGEEEAKSDSTSWKNCRSSDRDSEMHDSKIVESYISAPELKKPSLNLPVIDNAQSGAETIALEEVNKALEHQLGIQ